MKISHQKCEDCPECPQPTEMVPTEAEVVENEKNVEFEDRTIRSLGLLTCSESWCRDNCDCGTKEMECLHKRMCERECPCTEIVLTCLTDQVSLYYNLSGLVSSGYELRSLSMSLSREDGGQVISEMEVEGLEEELETLVMEESSRVGDRLEVCLDLTDREPVCKVRER